MTIGAATLPVTYSGNGVADTFAYSWKVTSKTHLSVTLVTDSDGTRTAQTVDVDYTVTGVGATNGGNIVFTTAPASGKTVVIDSSVPYDQPADIKNQGPFAPEIHENAFDRIVRQVQQVHRDQQASLQIPTGTDNYDAGGLRIVDLADGVDATDAATVGQLDEFAASILSGFAGSSVAVASGTGDGANVNLSFPGISVTVDAAYLLVVGGVLQRPTTDFNVDVVNERLVATTAPGNGVPWFAICIGYERAINVLASGSVGTAQLDDEAVTLAKMAHVATDTILGRSTAGTGDVEALTCTAAGRALLDDVNAAAQRTTLGLGTIATQDANNVAITGGSIGAGVTIDAGALPAATTSAKGAVEQATNAEVVSKTADKFPDASQLKYSQLSPKAWVYFTVSGTTVTVQASENVTSVVRDNTGLYTITLTNALTAAGGCIANGVGNRGTRISDTGAVFNSWMTNGSTVKLAVGDNNTDGATDPDDCTILVFGTLA